MHAALRSSNLIRHSLSPLSPSHTRFISLDPRRRFVVGSLASSPCFSFATATRKLSSKTNNNNNNSCNINQNDDCSDELEESMKKAQTASSGGKMSPITPRNVNFSKWYHDVISHADLVDSSPVRGCMILRPNGYAIWEEIQKNLDRRFKETGHKNVYFPLLIPQSFLSKEAEHVEGFAKECAVVTHHRLRVSTTTNNTNNTNQIVLEPDPTAVLAEPLVIRPTSETVIWSTFSRWVKSHRDLPLLLNQWANVVRWEMRCRPFLRTSEFLWQEGHTAHATQEEAIAEARTMLGVYRNFCEQILAVPVICGRKTQSERFAGADDTLTIEAMMQDGKALQSGTSHFLGQNFAKAFNVKFTDADGQQKYVWATSWGVSTRLIGAVIMMHSDDNGLVLPPLIAPTQIVIVPIIGGDSNTNKELIDYVEEVKSSLLLHNPNLRIEVDARTHLKPGLKYFSWERQGVPLRIEIGARDMKARVVTCAPRVKPNTADTPTPTPNGKFELSMNNIPEFCLQVNSQLKSIQSQLFLQSKQRLEARTRTVTSYAEMKQIIEDSSSNKKKEDTLGFFLAPWKDSPENEQKIKEDCRATIRCYPFEGQEKAVGEKCFFSGDDATHIALFALAY